VLDQAAFLSSYRIVLYRISSGLKLKLVGRIAHQKQCAIDDAFSEAFRRFNRRRTA